MVGTKVTKICINHRYSQSIRYIYDMCIRVCVYIIYIRIYSSRVFFKSLLVWESGQKKNYIYMYIWGHMGVYSKGIQG